MFSTKLKIRPSTFFGGIIEPNNITSNECMFNIAEELMDGLQMIEILSDDKTVIDKINSLYESYDYNVIPLDEKDKELKSLKEENVFLGQMVTDLELTVLEIQSALNKNKVEAEATNKELGTQITDIDLELLEHKVVDHK